MGDFWKRFLIRFQDRSFLVFLAIVFLVVYNLFSNHKKEEKVLQHIGNKTTNLHKK